MRVFARVFLCVLVCVCVAFVSARVCVRLRVYVFGRVAILRAVGVLLALLEKSIPEAPRNPQSCKNARKLPSAANASLRMDATVDTD